MLGRTEEPNRFTGEKRVLCSVRSDWRQQNRTLPNRTIGVPDEGVEVNKSLQCNVPGRIFSGERGESTRGVKLFGIPGVRWFRTETIWIVVFVLQYSKDYKCRNKNGFCRTGILIALFLYFTLSEVSDSSKMDLRSFQMVLHLSTPSSEDWIYLYYFTIQGRN